VRCVLVAALLVASLAMPGFAQASGTLGYTLSNPPTTLSTTSFTATIGGVQGTITTTGGGAWTMTVGGQPFASGTYTCGGGSCSFSGSMLSGRSLSFSMTHTSGTLSGLFATHGAWVSTVGDWANSHLSGQSRGEVVSQAAGGEGHASSHSSAQSKSTLEQGGQGNSGGHGGGHGHK
jgi:hypothetical protein